MGFFDLPFMIKVRRNHGLEHATIHILSQRNTDLALVGRSDWAGFTLYGHIETTEVETAAHEALRRLRQGEAHLAVHPRCGTILVVTGLLTALASFLVLGLENSQRKRFNWNGIPTAAVAATLAAVAAQPVGLFVQERYSTCGHPANLEIKTIKVGAIGGLITHRVETSQ